jgi:5-methylcytosine-specific restriction endonuclease McrA
MKHSVLVLNQNYEAISVCTVRRAFLLIFLKKAELIDALEDEYIRSSLNFFEVPSIIRLKNYVKVPHRKVSLSRANIFRRDGEQCVYCGTHKDLTIDHVIPRSKGGIDSWENLVTACHSCNSHKGNRTPEEAGMTMIRKPFKPSYIFFMREFNGKIRETWKPYLFLA